MSDSVPTLEPGFQIGDYVLNTLLSSNTSQQVWLGEQISVKREVEMVCYYGPDPEQFLADIRVKAQVEDGVLGLVYEAIPTEQFIAFAREVLPEQSLAGLVHEKNILKPSDVTRIIEQVSGAIDSLEKRGIARRTFDASDIRFTEDQSVRIHNIAKSGQTTDEKGSRLDFAESLRSLLQIGQPGATRMGTLLDYIEGTETQDAIPWSQANELAQQVHKQLSAATDGTLTRTTPVLEVRKSYSGVMIAGLVSGIAALVVGYFVFKEKEPDIDVGLIVTVPDGRYPRPNGGVVELEAFHISANEVTIGQYADFMLVWQSLSSAEKQKLSPKEMPEDKISVRPESWNDYYPLARSRKSWNGLKMSLDCPVVGVDWWDAQIFAKWKGGRLPTELEWWATCNSTVSGSNQRKDWGPVGGAGEKIYGLAGNVAEWSGRYSKDPAFPIDSAKPVVLGSSHKQPSQSALTREWVKDPLTRRDDLGFRIVFPIEK